MNIYSYLYFKFDKYSNHFKFTVKNPYIKKVLVDKYGMHVYTMSGRTKGSIVERFNRTLKERIGIKFEIWICRNLFFPCLNF